MVAVISFLVAPFTEQRSRLKHLSVLARVIDYWSQQTTNCLPLQASSFLFTFSNQKPRKRGCGNWKNYFKIGSTQTTQRAVEGNLKLKHAKIRQVRQLFHKMFSVWKQFLHHQTRNWVAICIKDLSPGMNVLISEKLPLDISLVWAIRPRG